MFLWKETSYWRISLALAPGEPSIIYLATNLFEKCQKHIISKFYLTRTNFTRICEYCFSYVSPGTWTKLKKVQNFLWILSTSGKIVVLYVFQHKNGGIYRIWAFWYFLTKTGCQRYTALVRGFPFLHRMVKQKRSSYKISVINV